MGAKRKKTSIGFFDFEKADLDLALVHNKACRVRKLENLDESLKDDVCPCCRLPKKAPLFKLDCDFSELSELGSGFPLFFYFTKNLIILTLLAGVFVGIPCAYINFLHSDFDILSSKPVNWYQYTFIRDGYDLPMWQAWLHCVFCIFLIVYFFVLKRYMKKKTHKFDYKNITPSDFTVWVNDLEDNYKRDDLYSFFQSKGLGKKYKLEVNSVSPVFNIGVYVKQVRKLEKLKGDLSYAEDYKKKYKAKPSSESCCVKKNYKIKHLKMDIEYIEKWLENIEVQGRMHFTKSKSAFVTFRFKKTAKRVLRYWNRSPLDKIILFLCHPLLFCFCCCYNNNKFNGKIIKVEPAPEPSDLIWENISLSNKQKFLRRFAIVICTLVFLIGLCFALFQLKSFQYRIFQEQSNNNDSDIKMKSISIFMGLIIIIVGRIVAISVRFFSDIEKHSCWTHYHKAVVNKLIFSTSLNTIVVLLAVNMLTVDDFPVLIPGLHSGSHSIPLYQDYGLANDLFWVLVTDTILSPLTYFLSPIYISKLCKRRSLRQQAKKGIISITQGEANIIWENPPVDMAQRYANYMKTLMIIFVFAPIFPIGLLIGFISMTIQYWTDKYLLLRRHSRPPKLGTGLSDNMIKWMPILTILYAGSNLITYMLKSENSHSLLHFIPCGVFCFAVFFFIFPCKCSCFRSKKKNMILKSEEDYNEEVLGFVEDYERNNPVTSRKGWEKWLRLVEEKKGHEKMLSIEQKLKSYLPGESNSVLQYALGNSKEPKKNTIAFRRIRKRHSLSILSSLASDSIP
ncbi:hypothetical protein SteCoe_17745 [Stentor coeruleus]|uniref:CSC1/OSCA1-like cytosolic domain-containing protein n=1 Tax=Stentor coeruleus TaxID=5963 RepID=A0A1R2BYC4_9CILI|nr:hypothetical protein SteCoe_17745 [Stentor coeruleus]